MKKNPFKTWKAGKAGKTKKTQTPKNLRRGRKSPRRRQGAAGQLAASVAGVGRAKGAGWPAQVAEAVRCDFDPLMLELPFVGFSASVVADDEGAPELVSRFSEAARAQVCLELHGAAGSLDALPEAEPAPVPALEAEPEPKRRTRRGSFSFYANGIPQGAVLVLEQRPEITAIVADEWHLEYEGKLYSTSGLAAKLLGQKSARGSECWLREGRTLSYVRDNVRRREVPYDDADGVRQTGIALCLKRGEGCFEVLPGSLIRPRASVAGLGRKVRAAREHARLDASGRLMEGVAFKSASAAASFVWGVNRSADFWSHKQVKCGVA